jgi:hypothetical protein
MNLQNLRSSPNPVPVSQFAKTDNYQPKTSESVPKTQILVDFSVGRQAPENSHTLTHAGADFKKQTFRRVQKTKNQLLTPFKLRADTEQDFLQFLPTLLTKLEDKKVVFHNLDYVEQIYNTYHQLHAHLMLEWVKTFAIIRAEERTELLADVIESNDHDFLLAFRLIKLQRRPKKNPTITKREQIWTAIIENYPDKPFNARDLENILLIGYQTINYYLIEFKDQKKLQKLPIRVTKNQYQLIPTI